MRLNLESGLAGSSTALLVVTGVIDWSTIAQFRAGLSRLVSGPRPDVLVDLAGLLSWSPEAQQVLAAATWEARLHGGRLVMSGLAPVPAWQAGDCDLPGLERVLEHPAPWSGQDAPADVKVPAPARVKGRQARSGVAWLDIGCGSQWLLPVLGTLEEGVEGRHDCYDLIRRSAEMRTRSAAACAEAAEIAACSAELASRVAELHEAARPVSGGVAWRPRPLCRRPSAAAVAILAIIRLK